MGLFQIFVECEKIKSKAMNQNSELIQIKITGLQNLVQIGYCSLHENSLLKFISEKGSYFPWYLLKRPM